MWNNPFFSSRGRRRSLQGRGAGWPRSLLRGPGSRVWLLRCVLFSSRRRHTRYKVTGVQTCALPICLPVVSEYQQLTTGKLSALSHNFPKNLVAHRFRRADEPAPRAAWTRLTQQMFQALAGALAGHFHQPERREAHDVRLGAITGQRPLEGAEHGAAVRLIAHVDEVDDDDAAEIAQPQLPRDAHRRLEVGAEDGLLEIAMTHIGAGVHVDGGHRLGLVDHQVADQTDRKSTRLNSSHLVISYAVFCLKKKNKNKVSFARHSPNSISTRFVVRRRRTRIQRSASCAIATNRTNCWIRCSE